MNSNLKLSSNIMLKSKFEGNSRSYISADLLSKYEFDARIVDRLPSQQKERYYKSLFYAEKIIDVPEDNIE